MKGENGANGRHCGVWYLIPSACIQYIFEHNNGKITEISFMGKREMINCTGNWLLDIGYALKIIIFKFSLSPLAVRMSLPENQYY